MQELIWTLQTLTPTAVLDILLVALVLFGLSFFIRGTQALTLLRGLLLLFGATALITNVFNLSAMRYLLQNVVTVLVVAIPVIFQPELRRALERLGRAGLLVRRLPSESVRVRLVEDICLAAERLSERRHGALIVLEKNSSLNEFMRSGVTLNAEVSTQILLTIFWPKTELHDGAVIIDSGGRIAAAAAVLPLSSGRSMTGSTSTQMNAPKIGTRHRAALGMSEISDSICVVVSEETGRISIANGGRLIQRLDSVRLRAVLNALYGGDALARISLLERVRALLPRSLRAPTPADALPEAAGSEGVPSSRRER